MYICEERGVLCMRVWAGAISLLFSVCVVQIKGGTGRTNAQHPTTVFSRVNVSREKAKEEKTYQGGIVGEGEEGERKSTLV